MNKISLHTRQQFLNLCKERVVQEAMTVVENEREKRGFLFVLCSHCNNQVPNRNIDAATFAKRMMQLSVHAVTEIVVACFQTLSLHYKVFLHKAH